MKNHTPSPPTKLDPVPPTLPSSEGIPQSQTGILIGLMMPAMMTGLYISMFGVAIPAIRADFGIQVDDVAWVSAIYTLPFMMFMPLFGRLGDALGKRRLFLIGIVSFALGTMMAGLAPNLGWFMAGRALQGFGSAGFVPLSLAIIAQVFPIDQRGKVMGTWNAIFPVTNLVGPLLGGFLIDYLGWRTIFWPTLLAGVIAFWAVRQKTPTMPGFAKPGFLRRLDWGGVLLLSSTITSFLFYVSSRPVTGVPPLQDIRLLISTLICFGCFIFWEKRQRNPLISLEIFKKQTFTLASMCAGIRMFAMAGIRFLVPLYLVDLYGLDAWTIGLIISAHAIPILFMARPGGQLADRWGSRWPVIISMVIQVGAMVYLALLPTGAGLWLVSLGVVGQSLGASISLAPLHRASMIEIGEAEMGVSAGVYSMLRFAGTVFGTALCGVVLQQGLDRAVPVIEAYQIAFGFVAVVTLVGVILGLRLRA